MACCAHGLQRVGNVNIHLLDDWLHGHLAAFALHVDAHTGDELLWSCRHHQLALGALCTRSDISVEMRTPWCLIDPANAH